MLTWATLCFAADPKDPANPNASPQAKAVLKYFQSLDARSEKHLISGQFDNYGDRASVRLMDQIHDKTGHYPALLGVDYAGKGGVVIGPPNQAAIDYWRHGGLVTVSTHLYDPENPIGDGGLRDRDVDLNDLLDEKSENHARWLKELDRVAEGLTQLQRCRCCRALAAVS